MLSNQFKISILRFLFVLLFFLTFMILYIKVYDMYLIGVDDANIFFKYAKNFVSSFGLCYNIGSEKVEGFTSILWLIIISVFYKIPHFEILLILFNVIIITFALYRTVKFIETYFKIQLKPGRFIGLSSILFVAIICFNPGFIIWGSLSLMETGIWTSFILLLTLESLEIIHSKKRNTTVFSLLIALSILTRPEGIFIGLFFALSFFYLNDKHTRYSSLVNYIPIFVFLIASISLTVFRLNYFGYPLPNTYYAKVYYNTFYNLIDGLNYYVKYLGNNAIYFLVLAATTFVIITQYLRRKFETEFHKSQFFLGLLNCLLISLPIIEGGDHFDFQRLYQPFLPVFLLILLNTRYWNSTLGTFNKTDVLSKKWLLIALILPVILIIQRYNIIELVKLNKRPLTIDFYLSKFGRDKGNKLNLFFDKCNKLPTVAEIAVGGFGYTYNGDTFDLVGLNCVEMAHNNRQIRKKSEKGHSSFSKEVFFKMKPTILLGSFVHRVGNNYYQDDIIARDKSFENKVINNLYLENEFISQYKHFIIKYPNQELFYDTYIEIGFADYITSIGYILLEQNP